MVATRAPVQSSPRLGVVGILAATSLHGCAALQRRPARLAAASLFAERRGLPVAGAAVAGNGDKPDGSPGSTVPARKCLALVLTRPHTAVLARASPPALRDHLRVGRMGMPAFLARPTLFPCPSRPCSSPEVYAIEGQGGRVPWSEFAAGRLTRLIRLCWPPQWAYPTRRRLASAQPAGHLDQPVAALCHSGE